MSRQHGSVRNFRNLQSEQKMLGIYGIWGGNKPGRAKGLRSSMKGSHELGSHPLKAEAVRRAVDKVPHSCFMLPG